MCWVVPSQQQPLWVLGAALGHVYIPPCPGACTSSQQQPCPSTSSGEAAKPSAPLEPPETPANPPAPPWPGTSWDAGRLCCTPWTCSGCGTGPAAGPAVLLAELLACTGDRFEKKDVDWVKLAGSWPQLPPGLEVAWGPLPPRLHRGAAGMRAQAGGPCSEVVVLAAAVSQESDAPLPPASCSLGCVSPQWGSCQAGMTDPTPCS